jgi:hypothetical protein
MPKTVYLVGCGKNKRPTTSKIRDLYTGHLFRKALAYAEASAEKASRAGHLQPDILVLSAYHGAIGLDRFSQPYDLSMGDLSKRERADWGRRVAKRLQRDHRVDPERDRLVVLAGKAYAEPLKAHFARVEEPMAGLGLGQRLRWLTEHKPEGR